MFDFRNETFENQITLECQNTPSKCRHQMQTIQIHRNNLYMSKHLIRCKKKLMSKCANSNITHVHNKYAILVHTYPVNNYDLVPLNFRSLTSKICKYFSLLIASMNLLNYYPIQWGNTISVILE